MSTDYDWIRYSNSGATRNKHLSPELIAAFEQFLPDLGLTMDVVSGGQDALGEGDRRTGSTRHDHGHAADVDFYKDGTKLDWNNEEHMPIIEALIGGARGAGITGIGAGDDYMGAGRFHMGFGAPSVWGAGGKGDNAPDWLKRYYYGAADGGVRRGEDATASGGLDDAGMTDVWRRQAEAKRAKEAAEDEEEYDGHFNEFVGETLGLNDFRSNLLDKIGLSDSTAQGLGRVLAGLGSII